MRVTATDHALAAGVGGDILLGKAFAFVGADAFAKPALAWVTRLIGGAVRPRVLPLLGPGPLALPGATVDPVTLPALALASVTSDKALYREGRDEVHLLALDPLAPHAAIALDVRLNGVELARHPISLDARGAAAFALRDLPPGDYEVRFHGAPAESPACAFTVATYRLAPLVASLVDRRLEGDELRFELLLESFGSPVDGEVALELHDRGRRVARTTATARAGRVASRFTLSGEGPHAIHVQLVADAARTAAVPIVGSRTAERSQTTFSTLGDEIQGSLLPGEGARPVRGIWLREASVRATPFRLERVDAKTARLTATADVATARVVVVDPTFPARRPDAVDPDHAPHPASIDQRYQQGEALFQAGSFAAARALFEEALDEANAPHPNYAYYVACCSAREGDPVRAIAALRRAIRDGWKDFALLARDEDLAALRGHDGYEALKTQGLREIALEEVRAGQSFDVDVPEPMAILAVGAYVHGEPWEGWAATITPAAIAPEIRVPERAAPGDVVRVEIDTHRRGDDAAVYVVVKDARLLTPDTPSSRLAGGLKAVAEAASRELAVGRPTRTLADACPAPSPPPPPVMYRGLGAGPRSKRAMPPGGLPAPMAVAAAAPMSMLMEEAECAFVGAAAPTGAPPGDAGPYRQPAAQPPPSVDEPEVLFAGLVETVGGRAGVVVVLGPDFADYVVEVFAVAGTDWASVEARFRAEKDVFVSLDVPAFVHPDDAALGRVHVGARPGARVRVTRDGAEARLLLDGRPVAPGEPLPGGRAELSFIAGPGRWEAVVEDASGAVDRAARDVEIPGKLRRVARTVQLLEPGKSLARDADPTIRGLRVLPGLDGPFEQLVDATADYGHACCEQTAAKLLAACAMYALAGKGRDQRARAESIILAGVRREASMFLPGRGFKMYPESAPEPNDHWGRQAAIHLQSLSLLRDLAPARALAEGLDRGLEMADDATRAYGLTWPPREVTSSADAYAALRFGNADGAALAFVRARSAPTYAGAVAARADSAYAAATLLRGGKATDRARALELANAVLRDLGPEGRLYSTVDSVAAIALAGELVAAKIVGTAGSVEVDGEAMSALDAASRRAPIQRVKALLGVTAIEVTRVVEEDFGAFDTTLPIAVSLKKGDLATRRLAALDAVDLEVTIEAGYAPGDLLWVCLPDALSRVVGGGQVKMFSVDFEGKSSVRVPLAATGITVGKDGHNAANRFAVCVRNMFEEERGGSPGTVEVTVSPPTSGGLFGKVLTGLRGLLGG